MSLKILFSQPIAGIGGSEKYLLVLLPALEARGIRCAFVSVYRHEHEEVAKEYARRLEVNNIKVYNLPSSSYSNLSLIPKISKIYKEGNYNVFHAHLIYADFWGSMIKRFFNRKMIVFSTKHGYHIKTYQAFALKPEQLPRNFYYRMFKFSESNINKSFACSHGLNEFHEKGKLVKPGQMDVIEHGFDLPEPPSVQKDEYRFAPHQLVIVGRIIQLKGHEFVIGILPELKKEFPEILLVIVGEGEYKERLIEVVKELDVEAHVKFTGYQTNVLDYTSNSDIVLVPSYTESMPLVILEGFNSKRPVIAFNTIGSKDLIKDTETGILVPAYDTNILKEKIAELLNNPAEANRLATNAFNGLQGHYTQQRMVDETIAFYHKYIP